MIKKSNDKVIFAILILKWLIFQIRDKNIFEICLEMFLYVSIYVRDNLAIFSKEVRHNMCWRQRHRLTTSNILLNYNTNGLGLGIKIIQIIIKSIFNITLSIDIDQWVKWLLCNQIVWVQVREKIKKLKFAFVICTFVIIWNAIWLWLGGYIMYNTPKTLDGV